MKELRSQHSIEKMSKVFEVSKSGYYRFLTSFRGKRAQEERVLGEEIEMLFHEHKSRAGSPKIWEDLKEKGYTCGRKRVARIMKKKGLSAKVPKKWEGVKRVVDQKKPNLLKQDFHASARNSKWVSDITYVRTEKGWAYLCAIMDLYSRKIVSHNVKLHMRQEVVVQALEQAMVRRKGSKKGLIFHSDQGVQYGSQSVEKLLEHNGIIGSMSSKGSCYDNAAMESFFSTLKRECVRGKIYKDVKDAESEIFNYIECYYNTKRKHSTLGYVSPTKFEEKYPKSLC